MTSMTPNHEQNNLQNPSAAPNNGAVQDNAPQQGGAQRSTRSLMNSLYRSPRARKNGAPDAEDTVPLAIAAEVRPRRYLPKKHLPNPRHPTRSRMAGLTGISSLTGTKWTTGRSGSKLISPAPPAVPVGACRRACCFWWRCWHWLPWCGV